MRTNADDLSYMSTRTSELFEGATNSAWDVSMKVRLLVNTSPIFWSKTSSLLNSTHPEAF